MFASPEPLDRCAKAAWGPEQLAAVSCLSDLRHVLTKLGLPKCPLQNQSVRSVCDALSSCTAGIPLSPPTQETAHAAGTIDWALRNNAVGSYFLLSVERREYCEPQ